MTDSLDKTISFLMESIDKDDRITLEKKMKYGYRYYYLTLNIDEDKSNKNNTGFAFRETFEIIFDNRNRCLEIISLSEETLVVEDGELLDKWNPIIENYLNKDIEGRITKYFEDSLSKCSNKSLHRDYKMKKIL